jgi:catechol 2,3-dioxygenase-like lactoylglutathione lyase family enzyme
MPGIAVRYIVDDVDAAIAFYTEQLGFEVQMRPGPGFAALRLDDLRLLVNATGGPGGASQSVAAGDPEPGGWNRIQLEVDDLEATVERLRASGATFRGDIVVGRGGKQILVDDPSGNCVELFEPHRG